VVDKILEELQVQLDDKQVYLDVDDRARAWLAKQGYDEKMGARPMGRLIQDKIKAPMADKILCGELADGGTVKITIEDDSLKFDYSVKNKEAVTS